MVNYANRVIDVMGGPTTGLTTALDQLFSSARDLSSDPASTVLRASFVRDAQGLTSRFGELSSQMDMIQNETDQAIESNVNSSSGTADLRRYHQRFTQWAGMLLIRTTKATGERI